MSKQKLLKRRRFVIFHEKLCNIAFENRETIPTHGLSAPDPPEFLWHLLTFCYAKKIFRSERIVRWLRKEHWLPIKPTERCLLAQDLRRFRRNNRKILMLSLEEFFKNQTCPESKDNRANKTETIRKLAEQLLLFAIQRDVGELDN